MQDRPDHGLEEALQRLAEIAPRTVPEVECRFFDRGTRRRKVALALGTSERTVRRD
ncbi:MAG: hypothetical protein IPN16_24780 [Gemmatimonadetes bacterium]|nr:hypothetical protein [Gemmatimonadota bacterium]